MLPTLWGAGHQPPQQPDAPEPVCGSEAVPPGGPATWPLSLLLLPGWAPKPRAPGLCQQAARLLCPSGPGHLAWKGHLAHLTPQPGHPWPPRTQWQGEPEPGEGHSPLYARQVTECPWHGPPGSALTTEASLGRPQGPTMPGLPLPGRVCSGQRRKGHGRGCQDCGSGGGQSRTLAHDVSPPPPPDWQRHPACSALREKPERLPSCRWETKAPRGDGAGTGPRSAP